MKRFRTKLLVVLEFEQEKDENETQRPDEYIEEEIEQTFNCKARIIDRKDYEL